MNTTPATIIWCAITSKLVPARLFLFRSPLEFKRQAASDLCCRLVIFHGPTRRLTEQTTGMNCNVAMRPGSIWLYQIASWNGQSNGLGCVAGPAQERHSELPYILSDVRLGYCALVKATTDRHWAGVVADFPVPCLTRSMGTLMLLLYKSIVISTLPEVSGNSHAKHLCGLSSSPVSPVDADSGFIDMSYLSLACL